MALASHFRQFPFPSNLHDIKLKQPRREMKHTPHYASAAVAGLAKKYTGLHQRVPRLCVSQSLQVRQVSKQIRHWKTAAHKVALSQPSPLPKSCSPHPRTECSSMGGLRRHKCVVWFVQIHTWRSQRQLCSCQRMTIFSLSHYTSSVWGVGLKGAFKFQNDITKLLFLK